MPRCPNCGNKMGKSGFRWSGHRRVQRYSCCKCGTTTIKKGGK